MARPWKHPKTGIYHIRVGIPERLRGAMPEPWQGKREYKRPLSDPETGEKARTERDAKRLWAGYWSHWDTLKRAAESEVDGVEFKLSDKQIDALCADWLVTKLEEYGENVPDELIRDLTLDTFGDLLEVNRFREQPSFRALRSYLQKRPYVAEEAARLLEAHSIPLHRDSEPFLQFCERLAWTGVRLVKSLEAHAKGDWSEPEEITKAPTYKGVSKGGGETIRQMYEKYKKERPLNERQLMEHDNPVNAFVDLVGDLPVSRVTDAHIRAYKDQLVGLGRNPATVSGRLAVLRRVFGYAVNNGVITTNPASVIKVEKNKNKTRPRKPWTNDELQMLLSGPVHSSGKRPKAGCGEAAFWLPLLGIFTGARLEDLAQLRTDDVREDRTGVDFLDVNDEDGKQIKNDSAPRRIPLHHQLLSWGFMDFVHQRREGVGGTLFPDVVSYRGQQAKAWGQWFGRYRRNDLGIDPKGVRKDFHSFRHGFADAARRAGIEETNRYRLLGHKHPLVGESYGGEGLLKLLKTEIDKIEFEGLDLSVVRRDHPNE